MILRAGGMILDPWQLSAMCDWMALTPYGRWVNSTCGGSVARQNGKSGLVEGRAEAGMVMYNEEVLYTAHLQKTATETFEEMASFLIHRNCGNISRTSKLRSVVSRSF